jgi:hypothetical protein
MAAIRSVGEADAQFDELRTACINDVERFLFLAASQYRRGCDLLHAGSAAWALVTLYYSSFFSAKALLGMFGVWMDEPHMVMEVDIALPGSQRIKMLRRAASLQKGTHGRFWDEFYRSSLGVAMWVDPAQQWVLRPIRGSVSFLTASRNRCNYDPLEAIGTLATFQSNFDEAAFPGSLRGDLGMQYRAADGLLRLVFDFAADFGLSTKALDVLQPVGTRGDKIRELVLGYSKPSLGGQVCEAPLIR